MVVGLVVEVHAGLTSQVHRLPTCHIIAVISRIAQVVPEDILAVWRRHCHCINLLGNADALARVDIHQRDVLELIVVPLRLYVVFGLVLRQCPLRIALIHHSHSVPHGSCERNNLIGIRQIDYAKISLALGIGYIHLLLRLYLIVLIVPDIHLRCLNINDARIIRRDIRCHTYKHTTSVLRELRSTVLVESPSAWQITAVALRYNLARQPVAHIKERTVLVACRNGVGRSKEHYLTAVNAVSNTTVVLLSLREHRHGHCRQVVDSCRRLEFLVLLVGIHQHRHTACVGIDSIFRHILHLGLLASECIHHNKHVAVEAFACSFLLVLVGLARMDVSHHIIVFNTSLVRLDALILVNGPLVEIDYGERILRHPVLLHLAYLGFAYLGIRSLNQYTRRAVVCSDVGLIATWQQELASVAQSSHHQLTVALLRIHFVQKVSSVGSHLCVGNTFPSVVYRMVQRFLLGVCH